MLSRTILAAALATTLLLALVPTPVAATGAQVTLRVGPSGFVVPSHWAVGNPSIWLIDPSQTTTFNDAPGIAGCTLDVDDANEDGSIDGAEVLDAATGICISGWTAQNQGFGLFVTSVDGLDAVGWPGTYWYLQVDGQSSPVGISDMTLTDGSSLELVYFGGPL